MGIKKENRMVLALVLTIFLFSLSVLTAQQDWPAFNVCCEKTKTGAWCQNTPEENCDTSIDPITGSPYRKTPTSCEATSFCNPGCCVDSEEGLCMQNTPQKVCQISGGTWSDDSSCNIPQCNLGCCLLGDQASFVTLTRCKRLSNLYGLTTDFRQEISDEAQCVLLAYAQDKGACVYETDGQRTCAFATRAECVVSPESNITSAPEFFADFLCSADELATNCGPTTETICVPGKDEVYFRDTCGNPANIYDANKIYSRNPAYWQKIVPKSESCGYQARDSDGNIDSLSCGNCDYLQGSLCGDGRATYGDFVCRDLNCYNTQNGNDYKNGESWCVNQGETGEGRDAVGSRYFRHVCIQGEETIEPCADFRNEVCIEEKLDTYSGEFTEAACRINRWSDCIDQFDERECLNTDKRDCYWKEGFHYDGSGSKQLQEGRNQTFNTQTANLASEDVTKQGQGVLKGGGICLPKNPPGLKFWEDGEAAGICSLGNSKQVVAFETNLFGKKECTKNCEVLQKSWVSQMTGVCSSLGDCGAGVNFAGKFTDYGFAWKANGKKKSTEGVLGQNA
jgi:hypothetical protein